MMKEVAGRLETYPHRHQPIQNKSKIGLGQPTNIHGDGDTIVTGVNALLTLISGKTSFKDVGVLLAGLGQLKK